ncbi:HEAT repeat domain-containing protein [Aureisphaera galaxeae]|uniref:HEAT repeat domain-containing protein n=1 Tax=Aureisphaera galaxeae TaxID=1538023 RepID=UPI00234FBBE6|nr:HEAT repeat domain-containing protein [Aureisphaera galaxeae]MDC8004348.1 HEAT repeat domain-containing protein [Aureisphaera galaxeae]
MDKETLHELWSDYVLGQLSETQMQEIASYLERHPEVKVELADWEPLMEALDAELEAPSQEMDKGFYTKLQEAMDESPKQESETTKVFRLRPWAIGIAASIVMALGFFLGKQWNTSGAETQTLVSANEKLKEAEQETNEVRTQLVISLADQPSASKRLEALSEVKKLDSATDKVIEALFKMLNNDPNVNVRLAAVTSLSKYVENPIVREGLVMSITQQESPLVQIALAELMVTLKEQKSINSMETLLKKPDINKAVKEKLEESIKEII